MATITGYLPIILPDLDTGSGYNFTDFRFEEATFVSETSTIVVIGYENRQAVVTGSFSRNHFGELVGDVSSIEFLRDGSLEFTLSDFQYRAEYFFNYEGGIETHRLVSIFRDDDIVTGSDGNDLIHTYKGPDTIYGGYGNDKLDGGYGRDVIYGNQGHDRIEGGVNDDSLYGGGGRDRIFGGDGDDLIVGGTQKDALHGGRGADTFVFSNASGKDRIKDFKAKNDNEKIDLSSVDAIGGWKDLKKNHMSTKGNNVVIEFDKNEIVLVNTNIKHLDSEDFIF